MAEEDKKKIGIQGNKYLTQEPSDQEVRSVLDAIQSMKRQTASPADMADLDEAEKQARDLYRDRANRAEWLSVAERIGNSLIRLGAAEQGLKQGVDLSGAVPQPDMRFWEDRIGRYGKELDRDLGTLGKQRDRRLDAQKEEQRILDTQFSDDLTRLRPELDAARDKYGRQFDTFRQDRQRQDTERRRGEEEAARLAREERRRKELEDRQLRSIEEKNLREQLKTAQEQYENALAAVSTLQNSEDLSAKSQRKLEEKMPGIMGKAGISPTDLVTIEEGATEKGIFWDSIDKKKRNTLLQEQIIKPKIEEIRTLRAALEKLSRGSRGAGEESKKAEAEGKRVSLEQLETYATEHFFGNKDAARRYLKDQGFTVDE